MSYDQKCYWCIGHSGSNQEDDVYLWVFTEGQLIVKKSRNLDYDNHGTMFEGHDWDFRGRYDSFKKKSSLSACNRMKHLARRERAKEFVTKKLYRRFPELIEVVDFCYW